MAPHKLKLTFWCGLLVFAGAQFAPLPRAANPPLQPGRSIHDNLHVPASVARLLDRACADCHSNQTRVPWYGRVAPASWLVGRDIDNGRRAMNFSEWPKTQAAQGLLMAACAGIQTGRMPLPQYLWMHPSARLTAEEKKLFCDWTAAEIARLRSATRTSTSLATASGTPQAP